jgi:hypothetical protein
MGRGLALKIKKRYPRAASSDMLTKRADFKKLGLFSFALANEDQFHNIINSYSQFRYGREKQHLDYSAMNTSMENIKEFILKMGINDKPVAAPRLFGCVNAGGNPKTVLDIFKYVFEDCNEINLILCEQ